MATSLRRISVIINLAFPIFIWVYAVINSAELYLSLISSVVFLTTATSCIVSLLRTRYVNDGTLHVVPDEGEIHLLVEFNNNVADIAKKKSVIFGVTNESVA